MHLQFLKSLIYSIKNIHNNNNNNQNTQGEADEAAAEARETDEKAKRFMLDAAKLAEELRLIISVIDTICYIG